MGIIDFIKYFLRPKPFVRLSIDYKDRGIVRQKWSEIQNLMTLGRPSNFRQAILEADKLLGFVLEKMNYKGSFGDKLKAAKDRFTPATYGAVWDAHKIRNRLVHEVGSEILNWDAKEAIEKFERGLRDLGVL